MRWIFLLLALACAALVFVIDSPGWLGLDILGVFVFGTMAVFGFAAARIAERSSSEGALLSAADLAEIRARAAAKSADPAAAAPADEAVMGSIAALRARAEARRQQGP